MESKKLNLGCGEFKKEGYVNVDFFSISKPDIEHNLNILPYPFSEDSFDVVEADHLLEHLNDPFGVLREMHRIAKDGARIIIRVPHFSRGFTHPEHKRGFDVTLPLYFQKDFKGGYQGVEYVLKKMKLSWFAQKYVKKTAMPAYLYYPGAILGGFFSFLANLSPVICSRIWCYWAGGFEEIEYEFLCKK
jgi:SAM-dependent methyltransferase